MTTGFDEYILNKMELKVNEIQQIRQVLMKINSFDDFNFHKNKLIKNMFDIEDEIRENYQLVKSTMNKNKQLKEELEYTENKIKIHEENLKNCELKTLKLHK